MGAVNILPFTNVPLRLPRSESTKTMGSSSVHENARVLAPDAPVLERIEANRGGRRATQDELRVRAEHNVVHLIGPRTSQVAD